MSQSPWCDSGPIPAGQFPQPPQATKSAPRNARLRCLSFLIRQATAHPHRTKVDWAHEVANLLDTRYANTPGITLVCDNLNTHTKGAFYEAFTPEKAREYVRRITFVYTPKHGSWLNVAECELSCLTRQCLTDRRIGDVAALQTEIAAWTAHTNAKQRAVDWQFTIDKARTKLKRLYPKT
jgi:DDE superfamily endonuclease